MASVRRSRLAAGWRCTAPHTQPEEFGMSGHAIHIKIDGRTYSGTYKVDRQVLTITTNYGKKTAQLGPKIQHSVALSRPCAVSFR